MKIIRNLILFGVLILLVSLLPATSMGQSGANFKFGPTILKTNYKEFTSSDQLHNGWQIGIKARFGRDKLYFNPGFYYRSVLLSSSTSINPFQKGEKLKIFNFPADMGYRLLQYPTFELRIFAGASLNYVQSIDENDQGIDLDSVYDAHVGGDIGFGFDFYWMTLDFTYEKGFLDVFKNDISSKADYTSVTLGFFF